MKHGTDTRLDGATARRRSARRGAANDARARPSARRAAIVDAAIADDDSIRAVIQQTSEDSPEQVLRPDEPKGAEEDRARRHVANHTAREQAVQRRRVPGREAGVQEVREPVLLSGGGPRRERARDAGDDSTLRRDLGQVLRERVRIGFSVQLSQGALRVGRGVHRGASAGDWSIRPFSYSLVAAFTVSGEALLWWIFIPYNFEFKLN